LRLARAIKIKRPMKIKERKEHMLSLWQIQAHEERMSILEEMTKG